MIPILALLAAYLIGGIPFGYLLVRWRTGEDVRTQGSGNIGATNVLRTTGKVLGIVTLLLDIGKGALAVYLMDLASGSDPLWMSLAALAVILGHAFPVFLKFQGGKAVASFVGAFLYLTPGPLFAVVILFVATVGVTKYVSLASMVGALLFPLACWLLLQPPWPVLLAAIAGGAFIIWRHRANWARLRAGCENTLSFAERA
ncbi:MAG: glycerol-3-phosphate 1-O-acyltransferase PlsY [Bryobacteraceae bacterium]|nr:glycerol-3-phosphate 1-O-acyltransferase PlsY [Bryobacteraceae bacterium]